MLLELLIARDMEVAIALPRATILVAVEDLGVDVPPVAIDDVAAVEADSSRCDAHRC
jgi:hypothetical protein